jgi:hypothetical protein
MSYSVPPVPDSKFSELNDRDRIIKNYLEQLRAKLMELEIRLRAGGL